MQDTKSVRILSKKVVHYLSVYYIDDMVSKYFSVGYSAKNAARIDDLSAGLPIYC